MASVCVRVCVCVCACVRACALCVCVFWARLSAIKQSPSRTPDEAVMWARANASFVLAAADSNRVAGVAVVVRGVYCLCVCVYFGSGAAAAAAADER